MEFTEKIKTLADRAKNIQDSLQTEEATKNALIMPFIQLLGYDIFNPLEVVPEFTADVGVKKGEKADYAIMKDGIPIFLIECKKVANQELDVKRHATQMFRYFSATKAKVIILTNGIKYLFFSDIEETGKLDSEPFLTFSVLNMKKNEIEILSGFCKCNFDETKILNSAGELKYIQKFEDVLASEYKAPSPDFVKYLIKKTDILGEKGIITQKLIEKHTKTTKEAFISFMSKTMKSALETTSAPEVKPPTEEVKLKQSPETTIEELEGLATIRALLQGIIKGDRLTIRDTMAGYCTIVIDDNILKSVVRLYFDKEEKYIMFYQKDTKKWDIKAPIETISDISTYKDIIISRVNEIL